MSPGPGGPPAASRPFTGISVIKNQAPAASTAVAVPINMKPLRQPTVSMTTARGTEAARSPTTAVKERRLARVENMEAGKKVAMNFMEGTKMQDTERPTSSLEASSSV